MWGGGAGNVCLRKIQRHSGPPLKTTPEMNALFVCLCVPLLLWTHPWVPDIQLPLHPLVEFRVPAVS